MATTHLGLRARRDAVIAFAGMPDVEVVLLLCAAALFAGWIDAVVGGGGLIQIPALLLLLPGASPAQVLATNKLSSVFGTAVAARVYWREVHPDMRTAWPMAGSAALGAGAGAACASLLPEAVFRPLVLLLLVLVGIYTFRQPTLGDVQKLRFTGGRHVVAAIGAAVTIGFYDGIFGPGTGSFLIFALVALMGYSFVQASAKAKIVNLATNLGALAIFISQGAPLYGLGLAMAACNMLGAHFGAATAISRGSRFVRLVFLVVVGVLVARLAVDVVRSS